MNHFKFQNAGIKRDLYIYLFFIFIAGLGIGYGNAINKIYPELRVWTVTNLLIMLLGIPFLFLQAKANLPDFWSPNVSAKNRWIYPMLIGVSFGLLDLLVFKIILHPEPYTELPPFLQPFPYSIFLYFSGAFEIEVFYRLIPLTLILLLGKWHKNGKYFNVYFWGGCILTSLREPLEQMPESGALLIIYSLVTGFLMNILQAVYFKKAGFLASIFVRLGHYLIWHILLGIYVEFVEL